MGRKGKTQKHTAAETAAKHKAAKEARGAAGGGSNGITNRKENKAKSLVLCDICKTPQPNFKSMLIHYENKHVKIKFDEETLEEHIQKKYDF